MSKSEYSVDDDREILKSALVGPSNSNKHVFYHLSQRMGRSPDELEERWWYLMLEKPPHVYVRPKRN